jgi:Protein of unknown function (DUF1812).
MKVYAFITNISKYTIYLIFAILLTSCESIYDGEGDCTPKYLVKLKYDMNIKFADAFSNEINSISAYLFNENGEFMWKNDCMKNILDSCNNSYNLYVQPGNYKIVVFGNAINNKAFSIPSISKGDNISKLYCKLNRKKEIQNTLSVVDENFSPLFHCYVNDITLEDKEGTHIINAPMVKNSNTVRVLLQNISGYHLKADDFIFTIEAKNGYTGYDNSLLTDELITYRPWKISDGYADLESNNTIKPTTIVSNSDNNVNVAIAEFTINRLVNKETVQLIIKNKKTIMSFYLFL